MATQPNKIDKDAVHTAVAITVLSALFTGIIGIGMDELKAFLAHRRGDDAKKNDSPTTESK